MSNSWWSASEESEKVFIFPPIWQFQGGVHITSLSRSPGISTHRWNDLLPWKQVSNQHKYNSTMEKANFPPQKKTTFFKHVAFETMNYLLSYCTSFSSFLQFFGGTLQLQILAHVWWTSSPRFSAFNWRHTRNTRVCSTPPGVAGSLRREFSCRGWTFE